MKRIIMAVMAAMLCIALAACSPVAAANTADSGSEATQAASEQPNGGQADMNEPLPNAEENGGGAETPPTGFQGGVDDPDAPDDATDLTGIVTAVQDGVPAITTIGGGAMPGGGMQPPGDGEEFQPPTDGEGFTPPNDGERPDMPSGENMPQGEETEVSLSDNTIIKKVSIGDGESVSTIQEADIEENAIVSVWLDQDGNAAYIQVMSGMPRGGNTPQTLQGGDMPTNVQ